MKFGDVDAMRLAGAMARKDFYVVAGQHSREVIAGNGPDAFDFRQHVPGIAL